ncbi:MAG: lysylphosphatidylglycerol synthase transmembrane domain-containing protein [Janthinobacterium lividum]
MTETASHGTNRIWKLLPGFAISGYFLWRTIRSIRLTDLRNLHLQHPVWLAVLVIFLVLDYGLRGYRWWYMLRAYKARLSACLRVLLTSLAANNILPFRVGDFMRIFAYAGDVRAPSSTVLSTVILERLLDIFMLFAFLVVGLLGVDQRFAPVSVHGHSVGVLHLAGLILVLASLGLGLLLFGTGLLHRFTERLVARFGQHPRTKKLGEWAVLLFDAVLHLSFLGRVWLVVLTGVIWACESMIFVSCARMIGLVSGARGPWLAASLSNLSFLLPSAPGGIGPFEASAKLAMRAQGVADGEAGVYALLVHVIILFAITAAGGLVFLVHRAKRGSMTKPLAQDLAALPTDYEVPETH